MLRCIICTLVTALSLVITPITNAEAATTQILTGSASWYGPKFHGRLTANGERFNMDDLTAAHRTLPFNTCVRVTDDATGKAVMVRINDRGPFHGNRVIDLSRDAAKKIGLMSRGVGNVKMEVFEASEENVDCKSLA